MCALISLPNAMKSITWFIFRSQRINHATSCTRSCTSKSVTGNIMMRSMSTDPSTGKPDQVKQNQDQRQEEEEEIADVILKEIPDSKIHWEYGQSNETAVVYDLKPIKIKCRDGRMYLWCACGQSRSQPFCDGTHKIVQLGATLRPVPWTCKKTGYYWFCNCKKSDKKVFCDGTHLKLRQDPNVKPTVKH